MEFLATLNQLFSPGDLLIAIVLLPLLGALLNGTLAVLRRTRGYQTPKSIVSGIAIGSVGLAFVCAAIDFARLLSNHEVSGYSVTLYEWFRLAIPVDNTGVFPVPVNVRFVMDHLSGIMTVMVTGIATLIHVYSTSYMGEDDGYPRFMTYLNLFTASMLILVLASNMPLMFVGWEGVGLCSYLLIGFWWENSSYAAAGRKAFVVNRIGDFGVLLGMFVLFLAAKSFEFAEINGRAGSLGYEPFSFGGMPVLGASVATAACLFLFLGCAGKSAQMPLYVWLPDAMAGPTPVSALIHAATMVTAGVYLCARLSPVFIQSHTALAVIAIVGALTAFLGASIGLVQNQMKKILAYSTVSQLGFMFAAVGAGAFAAGMFHVFTHAFFKACLFLGAGSVMHAVHAHGDADIRYLGNMRKYMPITHATFLVSCLAIAGFPLTSGFFSKDEILLGVLEATEDGRMEGWHKYAMYFVFVMLALTALMTAFYMFRLYFRTFWGEFKGGHAPDAHAHDDHDHHHDEPHESDASITTPLVVLAIGAVFAGFLGMPHWLGLPSWWGHFLSHDGPLAAWPVLVDEAGAIAEDGVEHARQGMGFGPLAMSVGTLVGLLGIALAFMQYRATGASEATAKLRAAWPRLTSFLMDKWRVDELYGLLIVSPLKWISSITANVDRVIVDGTLTKLPPAFANLCASILSKAQTGSTYVYTTVFAVGLSVMAWWFTYPHPHIESATEGANATLSAGVAPGTEFRWDFDGDGEFETSWSPSASEEHTFGAESISGLVATVVYPNGQTRATRLSREPTELSFEIAAPPTAHIEGNHVRVELNGARGDGPQFADVNAGGTLVLGASQVRIRIDAVYRTRVEARNAFGNTVHDDAELTVTIPETVLREENADEPQAANAGHGKN